MTSAWCHGTIPGFGWQVLTQPYIKNTQIFNCPSTNAPSYGYAQDSLSWAAMGTFASPAETVMVCDVGMTFNSGTTPGWDYHVTSPGTYAQLQIKPADELNLPVAGDPNYAGRPRPIHNDGCNVCFLDGHSKWLKTDAFYYGQTPINKYFDIL